MLLYKTRSFLIFALHLLFSFQGTELSVPFRTDFRRKVSLSSQIRFENEWAQVDSNHRPHAYQACALTGWAMGPFHGGDEGNRTPDPLLAKQVLSQLSYTPMFFRDWLVFSSSVNVPFSQHLQNWTMQLQVFPLRVRWVVFLLNLNWSFWVSLFLKDLGSP